MANRVINTILNLRNNMSGGLIRAARDTRGVTAEMRSATKSVVAFKTGPSPPWAAPPRALSSGAPPPPAP